MSSIDTRRIQTHKMIKTTPAYSSQPEGEPSAEIEKPNDHAPTTKVGLGSVSYLLAGGTPRCEGQGASGDWKH